MLFLLAILNPQARAATVTWVGGDGNWSNTAKWDVARLPTATDDVVIGGTGTYTVNVDVTGAINNLTIGGTSGVQTLHLNSAFYVLTLNGTATVAPTGVLRVNSGTLAGGTVNINGTLRWNSGTMRNGVASIQSGGTLMMDLTGAPGRLLDGYTLNNAGIATFNSTTYLYFTNGGIFNNLPSASLELQTNSFFTYSGGTGGTFNNQGTVRRLMGTGLFTIDAFVAFNNSGTVEVQAGTLELRGGGTQTGSFAISPGAALAFYTGNYTLNAGTSFSGAGVVKLTGGNPILTVPTGVSLSAPNVEVGGGTIQGGTLDISGTLAFNGGTLKNGVTTVGASGTLRFGNAGSKILDGHTFRNFAPASYEADSSNLFFQNNAVFTNESGAVLELRTNRFFTYSGATGGTFNNAGTVRRLLGTGSFSFDVRVALHNSGTVEVQTGTLDLSGGGAQSGPFVVSSGSTLSFSSGIYILNAGTSFSGSGLTHLKGAALNIASGATVPANNFRISGGNLEAGALDVSGIFTFNTGTLKNGLTRIPFGSTMSFANGGVKVLDGHTLSIAGTATYDSADSTVILQNNAVIRNEATGLLELRTDRSFSHTATGGTVTNHGTVRRILGANFFLFDNLVPFDNSGTVEVRSGRLRFAAAFTQTAGRTLLLGGRLESTLTGSDAIDIRGGTVEGNGTITGNVTMGGVLKPGLSPGRLTITGNYTQTPTGRIDIELAGNFPAVEFDQLVVTGSAALAGSLQVAFIQGYYPANDDSFPVVTFASRSGGFTSLLAGELIPHYGNTSLELFTDVVADLELTGSGSPDPVSSGSDVTYTLSVRNDGPFAATNIALTCMLGSGLTVVSATSSAGTCTGSACAFATLPVNGSASASIVVRTSQPGTVSTTCGLTRNETDQNELNDLVRLSTTIIQNPADPYISGFSPSELINGSRRVLMIQGQNLSPNATVMLQRGTRQPNVGAPDLLGRVINVTSSSIEVEFDLFSSQYLTEWDVAVTNPDGKTAIRPIFIDSALILPGSERSGLLGFAVGFRRPNYVNLYNAGNADGFVMLDIVPPRPGVIELQIASPTRAVVWDSRTEEDPSRAAVLVYLKKQKLLPVTTIWRVPPESLVFPTTNNVQASGSLRPFFGHEIVFTEEQHLFWSVTIGMEEEHLREVFLRAFRKVECQRIGRKFEMYLGIDFGLDPGPAFPQYRNLPSPEFEQILNQVTQQAIAEGVFTPEVVLNRIADALGVKEISLRYGSVNFPLEARLCSESLRRSFEKAFRERLKHNADMRRFYDAAAGTDLASWFSYTRLSAIKYFDYVREQQTPEGRKFAEQLLKPGGFIDQLGTAVCNPAPSDNNASAEPARAAWDPNDKTVNSSVPCQAAAPPSTQCLQYYGTPTAPIEFLIQFENKKEATDAATFVVITDFFDSNLDLNTVEVLATSHPDVFSMTRSGQTVEFRFDNIQLAPNVNPPEGEGYVRLRLFPVPGLPLGTVIQNQASIVFDFNPAILTPLISVLITDDRDRDGVIDIVEDRAPGAGDGNADGIPDHQQPHVTSLDAGTHPITLVTGGGCTQNHLVAGAAEGGQTGADALFDYTRGLISFVLPCTTAEVTVIHHGLASLGTSAYRFFSPTDPSDSSTIDWMAPAAVTPGTMTVGGAVAATTTFTLNDFDLGDQTDADGRIVHTGGLGSPSSVVEFSLDGLVIFEPRGTATVTVTRSGNAIGAASVAYSTSNGSATADDYLPASGTLSWADGDLAPKTFNIAITSDATREPEETINLKLTNPTGGAKLGDARSIELTITDRLIGDANGDRALSVADVIYLVNFLFAAGTAPVDISDVNADGETGVADVFYLVNHFFAGGPAPE